MLATLALAGPGAHFVGPWVGDFGFFFLLIPLFWIAVFAIIFSVARRRRAGWFAQGGGYGHTAFGGGHGATHWDGSSRAAESTLAERFAQGDIDERTTAPASKSFGRTRGPSRPSGSVADLVTHS